MELKMATTSLHWSQPMVPHPPPSQTLVSTVSSPTTRFHRRGIREALPSRTAHRLHRSTFLGTSSTNLQSCACVGVKSLEVKRSCSWHASLNGLPDEEFLKQIEERAIRFQYSDDDYGVDSRSHAVDASLETGRMEIRNSFREESSNVTGTVDFLLKDHEIQHPRPKLDVFENPWPGIEEELIKGHEGDDIISEDIERKANSVDLPHSLRFLKKKMKLQDVVREAGSVASCSVQKAFSSMVFMIRELHSYTLQLREILYFEDLQGVLSRVQTEIHTSFVWLFQQVFSRTPTLMVYLMILLANFTVYSIGPYAASAAPPPPPPYARTEETALVLQFNDQKHDKFDSSAVKKFSISIGGKNGGGGKVRPGTSSPNGYGRFDQSGQYQTILPDDSSQLSSLTPAGEAESASAEITSDNDATLWNATVKEASKLRAEYLDEALDRETLQNLVSPVTAKMEPDDYVEYLRTELLYQTGVAQEPDNPLLLANYAQFLYVVAHDYDRAEEYFKKAVGVKPADAEACHKYATFLWEVRKDFWLAEETFLEAISAEPSNSFYASKYAHFLWHSGGDDTCYPLTSPDVIREV